MAKTLKGEGKLLKKYFYIAMIIGIIASVSFINPAYAGIDEIIFGNMNPRDVNNISLVGDYEASCFFEKGPLNARFLWKFNADIDETRARYYSIVKILEQEGWQSEKYIPLQGPMIKIYLNETNRDKAGGPSLTKIFIEYQPGDAQFEGEVYNNLEPEAYAREIKSHLSGISEEAKRPPGLKK